MQLHPTTLAATPRLAASLVAALLLVGCASSGRPPVHRSAAASRAWLLAKTPLGSSATEVRTVLDRQDWHGPVTTRRELDGRLLPPGSKLLILDGSLGSYHVFAGTTGVLGLWVFADGKHLMDIHVGKPTLGL